MVGTILIYDLQNDFIILESSHRGLDLLIILLVIVVLFVLLGCTICIFFIYKKWVMWSPF